MMFDSELIEKPPVYKGEMLKRGSKRKNFLLRMFFLEDGILQYLETEHWLIKGERNLAGYTIGTSPNMKANQILLQPPPSTRTLHLFSSFSKTTDLLLETKSLEVRAHWMSALRRHIDYASQISLDKATKVKNISLVIGNDKYLSHQPSLRTSFSIAEYNDVSIELRSSSCTVLKGPVKLKGWLLKKGKFIPIWKRRFVEIENGELNYYDVDLHKMKKHLLGNINLENYDVELDNVPGKFILSKIKIAQNWFSEKRKNLSMQCEVEEESIKWIEGLEEHIKFAKQKEINGRNSLN
jgi:hypothetical protein